jgi:CHAD domain-containing protein
MTRKEAVPSLAASFTQAVVAHLERLREGERMVVADGDLKGVHLMRTSCRRLRATVKYLGTLLPGKTRRSLQDGLRSLMTSLGQVRDLDVLLGAMGTVPSLAVAEAEELRRSVEARRDKATVETRGVLETPEYRTLLSDLTAAAQGASDGRPVTWDAPGRVAEALSSVLGLKPGDWAAAPEESLHDLRKAVKKIRYALEAFAPAYGRPLSKAVERCRDLQESLGVIQDVSAFDGMLRETPSFWSGQFLATVRARADRERETRLADLWEKAFGAKALGRLGGHLFRRASRGRDVAVEKPRRREAI